MYSVAIPEAVDQSQDMVDLLLAYHLGHESEDCSTTLLEYDDYRLILKGSLLIELSNEQFLHGKEAYSRLGEDVLKNGLESLEPTDSFRVIDSPRFEWVDEFGFAVDTLNTISPDPQLEIERFKEFEEEFLQ